MRCTATCMRTKLGAREKKCNSCKTAASPNTHKHRPTTPFYDCKTKVDITGRRNVTTSILKTPRSIGGKYLRLGKNPRRFHRMPSKYSPLLPTYKAGLLNQLPRFIYVSLLSDTHKKYIHTYIFQSFTCVRTCILRKINGVTH